MGLEDPRGRERVPGGSSTTRSVGARLCANSSSCSGVVATRPAERARPPSAIATSQKSRCTSNPIDLPTPHRLCSTTREDGGRNDTYGSALAAHPGQVAGAASYTNGLTAHSKRSACPTAFSQSPRTGDEPRAYAPSPAPSPRLWRTSSDRYTRSCYLTRLHRLRRAPRTAAASRGRRRDAASACVSSTRTPPQSRHRSGGGPGCAAPHPVHRTPGWREGGVRAGRRGPPGRHRAAGSMDTVRRSS